MSFFTILIAVLIVGWVLNLFSSPKNKKDKPRRRLKTMPSFHMINREGDSREDEWHTYIAGLPHHASKYDIGGFTGWIENDSLNTHDSKAMAIYNSAGKQLGYIPAKELTDYRDWSDAKPLPCMGFIYEDEDHLRGRVKILLPCNEEFLQTEFNRYAQWVYDNYGVEYLPKSMGMQFKVIE